MRRWLYKRSCVVDAKLHCGGGTLTWRGQPAWRPGHANIYWLFAIESNVKSLAPVVRAAHYGHRLIQGTAHVDHWVAPFDHLSRFLFGVPSSNVPPCSFFLFIKSFYYQQQLVMHRPPDLKLLAVLILVFFLLILFSLLRVQVTDGRSSSEIYIFIFI